MHRTRFTDMYPLHRAAGEGDVERVNQLIDGRVYVDSRAFRSRTPLYWAIEKGRYEVAELLINRGSNLDYKDKDGLTPLFWAARWQQKDMVDLLIRHGAQVNCYDERKMVTLLHLASSEGWSDVVRRILEEEDADIDDADNNGLTPLMWAAERGHEDVAALLIRAGAEVNLESNGKTALHFAAYHGRTRVVQLLLSKNGLDLNPQDESGRTPLHWACQIRRREVVKQLLEAGADPNIKDADSKTALNIHIKLRNAGLEEIRLFVQHGAFFEEFDYVCISQNPFFKENILKDADLCTLSLINRFHRQSLPTLYKNTYFARKLPTIDNFKLNARQIDEAKNLVKCEIERNTFCNVVKAHPIALSALCVISLATLPSQA